MSEGSQRAGGWVPRWFWPSFAAPATLWLVLLYILPFYVILAIAFGRLDPLFLTPSPVYNPVQWNPSAFSGVVSQLFTRGDVSQILFLRTVAYVGIATVLCLLVGYPFAYFVARHAGRFKTAFLVAFIAPFWVSYMMRMLAWVSLLEDNGYINKILVGLHVLGQPEHWLEGKPTTVVIGLVYGYIPYMILPLYAALDRISRSTQEAALDLGAGRVSTFWRVTLPLSRQAILAGCVIVTLPMFGDYYTTTLLAASPHTAMLGNLIESDLDSSLITEGASLVMILLVLLIVPMLYYMRSAARATEAA